MPVANPLGDHLADAARGLQADGIEAGRDEAILELGGFAEVVADIGRKTLGAAKELLNAGFFQCRNAAHRVDEHRLEMAEVAGDLAE